MHTPVKERPIYTSALSVLMACGVLALFFFICGINPFSEVSAVAGNQGLEYKDNAQLVYPTLKYYAQTLAAGAGDGGFFYNINEGGGIRISPSFPHQLLIPSTWIAIAMGESFMLNDMAWILMADAALACLTAGWFLRSVFPRLSVSWAVLLTVAYALGGFFQTKYGFMQFLDHAAIFPLFALGLYRVVKGGKGWLYVVGLFLLATSMYAAFMAVVIGWLFAWAYTLPQKGTAERKAILGRVFLLTAAVFICTCYYWWPMIEMSRDSMRSLYVTAPTLMEWTWPFDPPMFFERLYACLPGLSFTALVVWYCWRERKNPDKSPAHRLFLLLMTACLLPVFIEPIHRAAHLWSYMDFPVRYGFIPCLVMVAFCARILSDHALPERIEKWDEKVYLIVLGLAVFGSLMLFRIIVTGIDNEHGLADGQFLMLRFALLIPFGLMWWVWKRVSYRRLTLTVAVFMASELALGAAVFTKKGEEEKAAEPCLAADELAKSFKGNGSLLRIKDADRMLIANSGAVGDIPTIGNFRHTTSIAHARFFKNLGYRDEFTRTYGQGGTLFTDMVLGHGYVLTFQYPHVQDKLKSVAGGYFYPLPESRSWGLVVPQSAIGLTLDNDATPFENINALYHALCPTEQDPLYEPVTTEIKWWDDSRFRITVPNSEAAIYGLPNTEIDLLRLSVLSSQPVQIMPWAQPGFNGVGDDYYGARTYNGIFRVNTSHKPRNVGITGTLRRGPSGGLPPVSVVRAVRPEQEAPVLTGQARYGLQITGHGGHVEAQLKGGEGLALMIPVIAERGWSATLNGQPVRIEKVGELMAVRLKDGQNTVVFDFFPPGLKESLIVSVCAVVCFLLYALWARKHADSSLRKAILGVGNRLFFIAAGIVIGMVYVGSIIVCACYSASEAIRLLKSF